METKELTAHQQMAKKCAVHPNTLAMLQRQKVVPRDVEAFSEDDVQLVEKLAIVMRDPQLLRLQLARKTDKVRKQLLEEADDFKQFKQWERKAIRMFVAHAKEGEEISKAKVVSFVRYRFGKELSPALKARIGVLKRIASGRVPAKPL